MPSSDLRGLSEGGGGVTGHYFIQKEPILFPKDLVAEVIVFLVSVQAPIQGVFFSAKCRFLGTFSFCPHSAQDAESGQRVQFVYLPPSSAIHRAATRWRPRPCSIHNGQQGAQPPHGAQAGQRFWHCYVSEDAIILHIFPRSGGGALRSHNSLG